MFDIIKSIYLGIRFFYFSSLHALKVLYKEYLRLRKFKSNLKLALLTGNNLISISRAIDGIYIEFARD
jgi:hypothetical protein